MKIVIVGNGISGVTAARWIRKLSSNSSITLISSETKHFYSRTALMYIYMGHMRFEDTKPYEDWFWEKNRIDLLNDHVTDILPDQKNIALKSGKTIPYDKVILALGSKPNKFGWPGQDLNRVRGLYHYQDLEYMEKHSPDIQKAVIVGGGLIGIEMAEMFLSRGKKVSILIREESYWSNALPKEESEMISRHIRKHHIDLREQSNLGEICDDGNGNANGVIVKETNEKIDCQYVGLTAGVSPNVQWLKESPINIERGIVVDDYLETNVKDIYAIGDCAQLSTPKPGRRNIEAVWYTGRMMGETVAYNICDKPVAYDPGIWFNSAKFLDIEYQVYGSVFAKLLDHQETFYWEHKEGEKAIRLVYDKSSKIVEGFNLMGIRFRHEVCEKWIKDKTHIEVVLENLALANFDPEFYKQHESEVIGLYNQQTGSTLKNKQKRSLSSVFKFLKSSQ